MARGSQLDLNHHHFIKCMVIGDVGVGKSSLMAAMAEQPVFQEHEWREDICRVVMKTGEDVVPRLKLCLREASAAEGLDHIRPLAYPSTDLVFFLFSLTCSASLEHVRTNWIPEIRRELPNIPCLLIGVDKRVDGDIIIQEVFEENTIPLVPHAEG